MTETIIENAAPATGDKNGNTTSNAPRVNSEQYAQMYSESIMDAEAFWGGAGRRLDWIKPYTQVKDVDYTFGNVTINWFADGTLNVSANCVDRHLAARGDQTAIIW
ncbi:MAG: acetyl-coenzyme A synthetase N-terminal domain-containing protein, partial [Pseudomonadota bacterium]